VAEERNAGTSRDPVRGYLQKSISETKISVVTKYPAISKTLFEATSVQICNFYFQKAFEKIKCLRSRRCKSSFYNKVCRFVTSKTRTTSKVVSEKLFLQ